MSIMPGFDPKTMTDDELAKKLTLISSRIAAASQLGTNSVIDQMMTMTQMINEEQRERLTMKRWMATAATATTPNETDPEFRDRAAAEAESSKTRTQVPRRTTVAVRRVAPTKQPVRPEPSATVQTPTKAPAAKVNKGSDNDR